MKYLLTTDKIDLNLIFNSDQLLFVKQLKKSKGKQSVVDTCLPLNDLKQYIPYCQIIIDRILYFQKLKEKSLINVNNLFVNISGKTLDKLCNGNRHKRINAISILKDLNIIVVNDFYKYSNQNSLSKSFSKSYRINPEYHSNVIQITGDTHTNSTKANNKGDTHSNLFNDDIGIYSGSCVSPVSSLISTIHKKIGIECYERDITISKKTGWIYSPITRLKRELRTDLIKSNNLVEIDIKSAHLQFFLTHLHNINNKSESLTTEINTLNQWVLSGKGYEYFMSVTGCPDRDCVKSVVMQWLASSGKKVKEVNNIREAFPAITDYIKSVNGNTTNKLLIELMKKESELINPIFESITQSNPESICLPLFDALIVSKDIANEVYSMLIDNGSNQVGYNFIVEIK